MTANLARPASQVVTGFMQFLTYPSQMLRRSGNGPGRGTGWKNCDFRHIVSDNDYLDLSLLRLVRNSLAWRVPDVPGDCGSAVLRSVRFAKLDAVATANLKELGHGLAGCVAARLQ